MKNFLLIFIFNLLPLASINAQSNNYFNEKDSSSLYPNPATNQVNLKFSNPNKVNNIVIYSLIGNEVLNKKVDQSSTFKLNIQNIKRGKYIVRIYNIDGTTESLTLVKN